MIAHNIVCHYAIALKFPADIKQLVGLIYIMQVTELKHSNPLLRYGDLDVVCAHVPYFHRPSHLQYVLQRNHFCY